MKVGGKDVEMLIDSGASCNVVSIKYLPKGTVVEKSSHTLKMYSKSTMSAVGKAKISLVNPKNMESYLIDLRRGWNSKFPLLAVVSKTVGLPLHNVWSNTGEGGSTPRKIGLECVAQFELQKPFILVMTKSALITTRFMTRTKIRYPIYDCRGCHSCPKHYLWKVFEDGLIANDEKVASSEKQKYRIQE